MLRAAGPTRGWHWLLVSQCDAESDLGIVGLLLTDTG